MEADILKVGHHGSRTSTSETFIEAVQPQVAILTYGKQNTYGHPVRDVLHHLWRMNVNVFSTAVYGDITIQTDGSGYYLFTEKDPLDHMIEETASIMYLKRSKGLDDGIGLILEYNLIEEEDVHETNSRDYFNSYWWINWFIYDARWRSYIMDEK